MSWKTVPNFFPEPNDLSQEAWYHLHEGFGVSWYETKKSGKYYKKVKVDGDFRNLLNYTGFANWHLKWRPNRSLLGFLFGTWKRI